MYYIPVILKNKFEKAYNECELSGGIKQKIAIGRVLKIKDVIADYQQLHLLFLLKCFSKL